MKKETYFEAAKDWYYDRYQSFHLQANRWFAAFLFCCLIICLLIAALIILLPLKTLVPLVIHQNNLTGEIWVEHPKTNYVPVNAAQVEFDIVRYITARESFSAADLNQRFHQVILLSAGDVGKIYSEDQSNNNPHSPVNSLGNSGSRVVHIEDIIFIDKSNLQELRHFRQPSQNLAKVDFTTTTIDHAGNRKIENWVATIGWIYRGMPTDQQDAWDNWNGFIVTTYRVDSRNI